MPLGPGPGYRVVDVGPDGRSEVQGRLVAGEVEDILQAGSQVHPRLGEPDGVDVGPDQVLVGEVQRGGFTLPDTIMWGGGRSTGRARSRSSSRWSPAPVGRTAGPTRALRVVGRRGRDVAQADDVESAMSMPSSMVGEQNSSQPPFAEVGLPAFAFVVGDLGGVSRALRPRSSAATWR